MSINGVDTATLFATIDAVKAQPDLARFQFRASNRWVSGTHNRSTVNGYYGAGQEFTRETDHRYDADHPPILTGTDEGPTPVEFILHALAACLTSGLANIAAALAPLASRSTTAPMRGSVGSLGQEMTQSPHSLVPSRRSKLGVRHLTTAARLDLPSPSAILESWLAQMGAKRTYRQPATQLQDRGTSEARVNVG